MYDQNFVGVLGSIQNSNNNIHLFKKPAIEVDTFVYLGQWIFQIDAENSSLLTSLLIKFFGTQVENIQFWIQAWHLILLHGRTICH